MNMLRPLNNVSYHEFSGICKRTRYENRNIINKCKGCPASILVGTKTACFYACKQVVDGHGNDLIDDGSIADEDLPYWFN